MGSKQKPKPKPPRKPPKPKAWRPTDSEPTGKDVEVQVGASSYHGSRIVRV